MHEKHTSLRKQSFTEGEIRAIRAAEAQRTPTSGIPYDQFKKEMFEFIAQGKLKYQTAETGVKKS